MNNIDDEKFKKGVEDIKSISMHPNEKTEILNFVLNSHLSQKLIRSPWSFHSIISSFRIQRNRFIFYGVISGLVLILCTSSIVYASSGTLPGNLLYPVKVNIVEPLRSTFIFSLQAKAEYESSLATERLVEAETLADQNKLDVQKETQLNNLLSNHTTALNNTLNKIQTKQKLNDNNTDTIDDDIITNFKASMNAHAQVLDVIRNNSNTNEQTDENQISNISNSARDNANNIRGGIKDREIKKSDNYVNRKKSIKSIIDSTTKNIDTNNNGVDNHNNINGNIIDNTYSNRKIIIDETNKTLNQARQLLQESNDDDSRGDTKSAYSKLLDSESSAKEAEILLKTGLNFNNRDN